MRKRESKKSKHKKREKAIAAEFNLVNRIGIKKARLSVLNIQPQIA